MNMPAPESARDFRRKGLIRYLARVSLIFVPKKSPATAPSIRQKGLIHFIIGMVVFVPVLLFLSFFLQYQNHLLVPLGLLFPGAYALAGLLEMATGILFSELASRWDSLKGWQRGVFGTFIVLVSIALIFLVVGLAATHL